MNIIEVLWKLGYDILSFNENGEYKIQLGKVRKDLIDKEIEDGVIAWEGSTDDIYTVKVGEVSFNALGNLFVEFIDVKTGEIIDGFEYNNMGTNELF